MSINATAKAVGELLGLIRDVLKTSPIRNMKNAIRNADKYIKTNKNTKLSKKEKAKLFKRYEKRFNKYKLK